MLIAFVAPIILPVLAAVAGKVAIVPIWAIGAATVLPVVLFSSPLIKVPRADAVRLLALAFPVLMVPTAPVIAIVIHRDGLS